MSKKTNKKIIPYRKPWNINIGVIIFLVVFIYMAIVVFRYVSKEKIGVFEVTEGTMAITSDYTGLILRDEKVISADKSGYVNYYIREGTRASVGSLVYTLDESGMMNSLLEQAASGNKLSEEHLARLKNKLNSLSISYDPLLFETVYEDKSDITNALLEYFNASAMDEITGNLNPDALNFHKKYAGQTGVVAYYTDGYEDFSTKDVVSSSFDKKYYERTALLGGKLVESGANVYKLITDDEWDIIFPISESDLALLKDKTIVSVSFTGTNLECNAEFDIIVGGDGNAYGKLHLYKYMVQFASERFVDFQINIAGKQGLKIPVSAVVNKAFYIIPEDYMTKGNNSTSDGFLKEIYSGSGSSSEFIAPTIYYEKDGFYYVDTAAFDPGDYLIKPDSEERYMIGQTASLQGVFNINKGYAIFKQIDILDANEEYYIVRKNMAYGLSVYDHIILNGSLVSENDLIYE